MKLTAETKIEDKLDEFFWEIQESEAHLFPESSLHEYIIKMEWSDEMKDAVRFFAKWLDTLEIEKVEPK